MFFAIARRGWSTVNTGACPWFTCSVALAMTSMLCCDHASECALSRNNGMSPDVAGGLREASCNVEKCSDQDILSCSPNFVFFQQLIEYLCAWLPLLIIVFFRLFLYAHPFSVFGIETSLGNVTGGTELLSMIGVVCSSPPANSLVT